MGGPGLQNPSCWVFLCCRLPVPPTHGQPAGKESRFCRQLEPFCRGNKGARTRPARKMMVGPALLLLLVLWPAAAQGETPYEKFQRQHVDTAPGWEPDPSRYCRRMMPQRNMTVGFCKQLNSFVHGDLAVITAVCGAGGTPRHGDFHYSNSPFNVTDCRARGAWPNCNYRGVLAQKQICLACDKGVPVHYAKPAVCSEKAFWGED